MSEQSSDESFHCQFHLMTCAQIINRRYKSTQDIDKYADFIITAISTAVDKAILTSKSGRTESQPISEETFALIKEKHRHRRQYSQAHDPLVKTHINQLQKEIKDNLRIE